MTNHPSPLSARPSAPSRLSVHVSVTKAFVSLVSNSHVQAEIRNGLRSTVNSNFVGACATFTVHCGGQATKPRLFVPVNVSLTVGA